MNTLTANRLERPLVLSASIATDLMITNPISIRADASVPEASKILTDKGIAAAPVIDEAGRPIGVVSRSDLLVHHVEARKHHGEVPDYFAAPTFEFVDRLADSGRTTTVSDVMTPAVFAVAPDTPVHRVVSDMLGLHVHRLFVVDDDGVLVGVISTMDVLKHLSADDA